MNWLFLIIFGIAVIALIVFLVVRNWRDEKLLEDQINNNYPKPKAEEGDAPIEEALK